MRLNKYILLIGYVGLVAALIVKKSAKFNVETNNTTYKTYLESASQNMETAAVRHAVFPKDVYN